MTKYGGGKGGRSRKMTKTQKKIEDAIKLYIKKRSTQKIFRKKKMSTQTFQAKQKNLKKM